jgi:hypothetical protein
VATPGPECQDHRYSGPIIGIPGSFNNQELGKHQEPDKCILVVREHNHKTAKAAFLDLNFKVHEGNHYTLGVFLMKTVPCGTAGSPIKPARGQQPSQN